MTIAMEPGLISPLLTNIAGVTILIGCYIFGVWSRTYIYPTDSTMPLKRQLIAAIPVGLVSMGLYGKSAIPALDSTPNGVFDVIVMLGYAVIFGMLSRESLEKILDSGGKKAAAAQPLAPAAPALNDG